MFENLKAYQRFGNTSYLMMLKKLLPRGDKWGFRLNVLSNVYQNTTWSTREIQNNVNSTTIWQNSVNVFSTITNSKLGKYLYPVAKEFSRLESRLIDLKNEFIPGLANEMLPEIKAIYIRNESEKELVAAGIDPNDSLRRLAHGKEYNEAITATSQFYIDYADTLGFTVTVNEDPDLASPFVCGVSRCADYNTILQGILDVDRMGSRRSFQMIEITITDSVTNANLDLMKSLFDDAKPAHIYIRWVDNR